MMAKALRRASALRRGRGRGPGSRSIVRSLSDAISANDGAPREVLDEVIWRREAAEHALVMEEMLYPPGPSLFERKRSVHENPLFNFLHRYYKYSAEEICRYSPGEGRGLLGVTAGDSQVVEKYLVRSTDGTCAFHDASLLRRALSEGKYEFRTAFLRHNREVLRRTISKPAFLGCFGMHEWAMLYSGRNSPGCAQLQRHQTDTPLRVEQHIVDEVVESGMLKCTHFDAWRFFHPSAQPMNMVSQLSRETQKTFEQPGCLHATMDLFKFAYQIYPFAPAPLLRSALRLALAARRVDIRASPYEVTRYLDGQGPLRVETEQGRREYAVEQEALSQAAVPVRRELLEVYERALS